MTTRENNKNIAVDAQQIIDFIRQTFNEPSDFIGLHEPRFFGNEKEYLLECIDTTYVSSVGKFVNQAEAFVSELTGRLSIAVANGTVGLHIALHALGVKHGDLVITQPLSFAATSNAILHAGASPIFIDVDDQNFGLDPDKLRAFISEQCVIKGDHCFYKSTNQRISACMPAHLLGFSCRIDEIVEICNGAKIPVVEDAAESMGTSYKNQAVGTFGEYGVFSLNGNKIVTSGGGGFVVCRSEEDAKKIKHLTTVAKVPHAWKFFHDQVGYNYRMPNINAALALAQMENLERYIVAKKKLAKKYKLFFKDYNNVKFWSPSANCQSNYWMNTVEFRSKDERDNFLSISNGQKVMTRPLWELINTLPAFQHCKTISDEHARRLQECIVNIPSSVIDYE